VRASQGVEGTVSLAALAPSAGDAGEAAAGGGLFAEALERETHGGSAPPESVGPTSMEIPEGRSTFAGDERGSLVRASLIPTGMLTRPALGLEWEPQAPREPMPTGSSGLFAYNGSGIPRPARPPYPELDRSMWVTPAPRPGADDADVSSHVSEAPAYEATYQTADAGYEEASDEMLEDAPAEMLEDAADDAERLEDAGDDDFEDYDDDTSEDAADVSDEGEDAGDAEVEDSDAADDADEDDADEETGDEASGDDEDAGEDPWKD